MIRRLTLICAITVLSGSARGQPSISVEPDSILFGDTEGAVNFTHVVNRGTESLRIDSLSFIRPYPVGWWVEMKSPDSTFRNHYRFGSLTDGVFAAVLLQRDDSMRVELLGWDCLICKTGRSAPRSVYDSLYIHSSDSTQPTVAVPIDFRYYVTTERAGHAATDPIRIFPNPVTGESVAIYTAGETGTLDIVVSDILGRVLAQERREIVRGRAVEVDLGRRAQYLSAGTYLLTIRTNHRTVSRQFVVAF